MANDIAYILAYMNETDHTAAQIIWDYMVLGRPIGAVDWIVVLGSRDDRVATYAADVAGRLNHVGLIVTGGQAHHNDLLATSWQEPTEAEHFERVMREAGCQEALLLEKRATNTGENALFSYRLREKQGATPVKSLLIVTKPYMERRALATFEAQWPDPSTRLSVTSPQLRFDEYINDEQPLHDVVNIMVGDLQRIIDYPARGFQSPQYVPEHVLVAAEQLKQAGYTAHL